MTYCTTGRKWHDNSEKCTYVLDDLDSLEHWCVYIIQGAATNLCQRDYGQCFSGWLREPDRCFNPYRRCNK